MHPSEAMWISFSARWWKPNAVKVGVGEINAVTGQQWHERLTEDPQDYIVCPDQPWLEGVKNNDGLIEQFVAPSSGGYAAESDRDYRLQLMVFEPRAGRFPDCAGHREYEACVTRGVPIIDDVETRLSTGAGIKQMICPDRHGIDVWDPTNYGRLYVHVVSSIMFREITGKEPPPSPVGKDGCTEMGLPWSHVEDT